MRSKMKKKGALGESRETDLLDKYLAEMDDLVNKYPEDPNMSDLTEQKLCRLIEELDDSWMCFKKKWQRRLTVPDKVMGRAKVRKDKKGERHLVIKKESGDEDVLDLVVADTDKTEV